MKVLVIIPAYNEELNIKNTITKLKKVSIKKYTLDYIIINDCSSDNTKKICQEENYNVINLIENLGIGGAVQTGYKYAYYHNYDIAIQFDGDGQHDENYLKDLIAEIKNDNDLVIGSRFISNLSTFRSSKARIIGIKILSRLIYICSGRKLKVYDPTSGFRATNKKVIEIFAHDYPIEYPEPETIISLKNANVKIKEIPVKMHKREYGESSIKPLKSFYYMFTVSLAIIANSIFNKKERKK